jgi:hypothetical protein
LINLNLENRVKISEILLYRLIAWICQNNLFFDNHGRSSHVTAGIIT